MRAPLNLQNIDTESERGRCEKVKRGSVAPTSRAVDNLLVERLPVFDAVCTYETVRPPTYGPWFVVWLLSFRSRSPRTFGYSAISPALPVMLS